MTPRGDPTPHSTLGAWTACTSDAVGTGETVASALHALQGTRFTLVVIDTPDRPQSGHHTDVRRIIEQKRTKRPSQLQRARVHAGDGFLWAAAQALRSIMLAPAWILYHLHGLPTRRQQVMTKAYL